MAREATLRARSSSRPWRAAGGLGQRWFLSGVLFVAVALPLLILWLAGSPGSSPVGGEATLPETASAIVQQHEGDLLASGMASADPDSSGDHNRPSAGKPEKPEAHHQAVREEALRRYGAAVMRLEDSLRPVRSIHEQVR